MADKKISEFSSLSSLSDSDICLVNSNNATFKTTFGTIKSFIKAAIPTGVKGSAESSYRIGNVNITLDNIGTGTAGFHNSIFRGKNLGTSVTSAQWTAIGNGTFDDLFIGDYWVINGVTWRIAAFDYWYNTGDTVCTTHHIVIVPDTNLLSANGSTTHWLHHEDKSDGAYVGTDFYAGTNDNTGKAQCRSKAQSAFGSSHILTHRVPFQNSAMSGSTNVGYSTAGAWYDSDIDIMSEPMVYGSKIFADVKCGGAIPNMFAIDNSQLPLFALAHSFICNRALWWLRDVVSATYFAGVYLHGTCHYFGASSSWVGVRPAFGIRA